MSLISRPKTMLDIARSGTSPFRSVRKRVNLDSSFVINLSYVRRGTQILIFLALLLYTLGGSVLAPTSGVFAAQTDAERKALEAQLSDLENQIAEHEATVAQYKQQGVTLKSEVDRLNAQIAKLNLQIKAVTVTLQNLDADIYDTQSQIVTTEDQITRDRNNLGAIMQALYETDDKGIVAMLLENADISDFSSDVNNFLSIQDGLRATIARIVEERERLIDQKQILSLKKSDALKLKEYQDSQKSVIQNTQQQKNTLLTVTKGQESKYQDLLQKTKKSAAEIRSRIFQLLGGGELTFEAAYQLATLAEKATGVRAAFTLAILDRESALGQNVGRCSYKTAMHPTRDIPVFLNILKELNINPDSVMVSCANSDGAYGGAMGPAQFIPSTWAMYSARVGSVTGSNPASPWKNSDAFVATGLYIKDSIVGCRTVYSKQADIERCAAAKYYSGSRWRSYLWTYGDRTVVRANQFQADIEAINS